MTGLTEQVGRWAAARHELPAEVVTHTKRLLLDHIGGVVAGSRTDAVRQVADYARLANPGTEATAIGVGTLSAEGAALVNGTAAHSIEVDDGYTPGSVHPSAVALPAVLASAQRHAVTPDRLLAGVAVAVELTCRFAAAGHPATWRNGLHNTPLAGVLGAAAGVGTLLGANAEQIEQALGIAASHAGGLFAFLGQDAEVKRLHAGKAARDGLASAELALRGLTGPRGVLEGKHGYFAVFARDEYDPATVQAELGTRWAMLRTYVKPYPCCRHLHGPIDAALRLRTEPGFDPAAITGVAVHTYTVAAQHNASAVDSFLGAQMSIPYAVAVALHHDEVGLAEFAASARARETLRVLAGSVEVHADPAHDAVYPTQRPARVTVSRTDAPLLTAAIEQPYGEPDNPVSEAALESKVRRLCEPVLGQARTGATIRAIGVLNDLAFLTDLAVTGE